MEAKQTHQSLFSGLLGCAFPRDRAECEALLLDSARQALARDFFVLIITENASAASIEAACQKCAEEMAPGEPHKERFRVLSSKALCPGTDFDPACSIEALSAFFQSDSPPTVVLHDVAWVLDFPESAERVADFEKPLSALIRKARFSSMCLFNASLFPFAVLHHAACFHSHVYVDGEFLRNPQYISTTAAEEKDRHPFAGFLRAVKDWNAKINHLRNSRQQLTLAMEAADCGIFDWDLRTGEVVYSDQWYTMLGYKPGAFPHVFETFKRLVHPDDFSYVEKHILPRVQSGERFSQEFRMQTQGGDWRWILGQGQTVEWDEAGKPRRVLGAHVDIHQRKTIEMQQQNERERLEKLLESIPANVALLTPDYDIHYANSAFKKDFGFVEKGRCHAACYHQHFPCDHCTLREVLQSDQSFVRTVILPDGRRYLVRETPYRDPDNTPLVLQIAMDVTNQHDLQMQLEETQEHFQVLSDTLPHLISLIDRDLVVQYVNKKYSEVLQQEAETLKGQRLPDLIGEDVFASMQENIDKALRGEPVQYQQRMEYPPPTKTRYMDGHLVPSFDADGQVSGFYNILSDITDFTHTQQALREEETRYATIFELVPDGILILSQKNNQIVQANEAAHHMYGFDPAALLSLPADQLLPEEEKDHAREAQKVMDSGRAWLADMTHLRQDGQRFHVSCYGTRMQWRNETHYLLIIHDNTFRREQEARLRQAEKMEAIGTLAAGIAHDFNNILSAVLGYSELALADIDKAHPAFANIRQIYHAGHRARRLVDQILTFSRQSDQARKPVMVPPVIKETVRFLRASLPATITIKTSIDNNCPPIIADATALHQIIMNLCTNAFHSMKDSNDGILEVRLKAIAIKELPGFKLDNAVPQWVCLDIIDTGAGMDKATLSHIFEPYFTTKKTGEGTGLGLATVHSLVQANDGHINVKSTPGKGTVFSLFFPVSQKPPDAPALSDSQKFFLKDAPKGKECIMVVDDEINITDILSRSLSRLGYETETYQDPTQALEAFRQNPEKYDLILTDFTMPHLTGDRLAEKLHAIKSDIPIVLCTGYGQEAPIEILNQFGICEILHKPITGPQLAEQIRRVLNTHTTP